MHAGHDFGGFSDQGAEDVIDGEILADGTIKLTTSPISGANHTNAEGLMTVLAQKAGGEQSFEARHDHHEGHHHKHNDLHQHH